MGRCGTCKHYALGECTWWLHAIEGNPNNPECFLPKSLHDYPRIPQGQRYPAANGYCRYCGVELTGRKTAYCSEAHASTYTRRFMWPKVRIRILERDQDKCVDCGAPLNYGESEIDHIHARVNGGSYWDYANLQTLCVPCHKRKTKQDLYILKRKAVDTVTLELFLHGGES